MDIINNSKYSEQAFDAINRKDIDTIASILKNNVHPDDLKDNYGNTALFEVGNTYFGVEVEHLEIFKLLLSHGANPNYNNNRPLINRLCKQKGKFGDEMIKLAIAHGADIYSFDYDRNSLLQSAAWNGKAWLVKMLVDKGFDVNYKNERGENALFCSINAFHENIETIQLLLENGANKSDLYKLHNGKLILNNLIIGNRTDVLNFLVSLGVDINTEDENGNTIIIESAEYGPPEMFHEILKLGANIDSILHGILHRINFRMCSKTLSRTSVEEAFQKLKILHNRNYPIAALDKVYNRHIYSDMLSDFVDSVKNRKALKKYEENIIISLLEMGFEHKCEKTFSEYLNKVNNTKIIKYLVGAN